MADTPNYNLPYPDDYTQLADVPAAVKALAEATDDALGEKVGNTEYASANIGGVLRTSNYYGFDVSNTGVARGVVKSYSDYNDNTKTGTTTFISKGTLDNVLAAVVGDINGLLDQMNREVI